jgi:redox-sensing transcriptional repressor
LDQLHAIVSGKGVHIGIITVPAASAQKVADLLVKAGVNGLVNLAPARLRVPRSVFVEDMDVTLAIEKVAYFSKVFSGDKGGK